MEKEKHVFLALDKENKLIKTNEEQADYVRIPIDDYYEMLKEEITADGTGTISIPVSEYNGYQKAIRIIRDRSLQQIDKEKADDNGYILKYAEKRKISNESQEEAFLVTKTTPYSIKIFPKDAVALIEADLRAYYNYIGFPTFCDADAYGGSKTLSENDIVNASHQFMDSSRKEEFLLENSICGRKIKRFFEIYNGKVAFKLTKLSSNYALGLYEVSYWATDII